MEGSHPFLHLGAGQATLQVGNTEGRERAGGDGVGVWREGWVAVDEKEADPGDPDEGEDLEPDVGVGDAEGEEGCCEELPVSVHVPSPRVCSQGDLGGWTLEVDVNSTGKGGVGDGDCALKTVDVIWEPSSPIIQRLVGGELSVEVEIHLRQPRLLGVSKGYGGEAGVITVGVRVGVKEAVEGVDALDLDSEGDGGDAILLRAKGESQKSVGEGWVEPQFLPHGLPILLVQLIEEIVCRRELELVSSSGDDDGGDHISHHVRRRPLPSEKTEGQSEVLDHWLDNGLGGVVHIEGDGSAKMAKLSSFHNSHVIPGFID